MPASAPATVHYHYCGEMLVPTGLTYAEWLELLFRTRGIAYWLVLLTRPRPARPSWVEQDHDAFARLFPDFAPDALRPPRPRRAIPQPCAAEPPARSQVHPPIAAFAWTDCELVVRPASASS